MQDCFRLDDGMIRTMRLSTVLPLFSWNTKERSEVGGILFVIMFLARAYKAIGGFT